MLPGKDNPLPLSDWTLEQWCKSIDNSISVSDVINMAVAIGVTKLDRPWPPATVYDWMNQGIVKRSDAVRMIKTLHQLAVRYRTRLLMCDVIREHSRIFLRSSACRQPFADLDEKEIWEICEDQGSGALITGQDEIWRHVYPPPPARLFGRKADLALTLNCMEKYPVTIIDGAAGDGKTSLAWFAARKALEVGLCNAFDWKTDKRYILDDQGKPIKLGVEPLNFEDILVSLVLQFKWNDLIGLRGTRLERACAERLRTGLYLIVVDNLETVPDSTTVVKTLLSILERKKSREPLTSRALITSRVRINQRDCAQVPIQGIEQSERAPYIRYLEPTMAIYQRPLSDQECHALSADDVTGGNPLFIQLALYRYSNSQNERNFNEIVENLRQGSDFYVTFTHLFEGLVNELSADAKGLAEFAAFRDVVEHDELWEIWIRQTRYPEMSVNDQRELKMRFVEAIDQLIRCRILNTASEGTYTMHSLIRSYLRSRSK
jgi:hypothetical protein